MRGVNNLKNKLKYIKMSAIITFKSETTYVAATILSCISQIILLIAVGSLWKAIYRNEMIIGNYDLNFMLAYWIVSLSIGQLYPMAVSKSLGSSVKNGSIARLLLKPVSIELQETILKIV
jgi:ABC-type uncharacterized transport system permease subunit